MLFRFITAIILTGLFYLRRDTGPDNAVNKILRIVLYGIAILVLIAPLLFPWMLSTEWCHTDSNGEWQCEQVYGSEGEVLLWFLLYSFLFALTGSFLGYETYDPAPSYSYKSSIPPSKPIFSDRRGTPVFTPQNELTTIECPGCSAHMDVPKLGAMQNITCSECGLSGEIEI